MKWLEEEILYLNSPILSADVFSIHCVSDTALGIKPTAMSKGNLHNNEGRISVMSGSAGSTRKTGWVDRKWQRVISKGLAQKRLS